MAVDNLSIILLFPTFTIMILLLMYYDIRMEYMTHMIFIYYKKEFKYLEKLREELYKLYFGGEKSKIEKLDKEKEIEKLANKIIKSGDLYLKKKWFDQEKEKEIKEIVEYTKEILL